MFDFLNIKTYWFVSFQCTVDNKTFSENRIIIDTRPFWQKVDIISIHKYASKTITEQMNTDNICFTQFHKL
ncbi:TPA: hypothetical protein ACIKX3_000087 [Campylobacter jejuni]|uniref:hypothetical protein n=1 Tax=Campylobacter jejuni TaxID=197 RepID=UPI000F8114C6|nr:hypothetical protein [Campylobacter jejuni]EAI3413862.1 hypothetical protein [Campylobacter jejuni]RTJ02621.1 hypothetical protein C3H93_03515 [Campylobacter jejuni]